MKTFPRICICFAALLFCSGCATSALWEEGRFARFREPTTPSKLELFENAKQKKVLIVYEEGNDENGAHRRRAYWSDLLADPPNNPFHPSFVSPKKVKGLTRIPTVIVPSPDGYSAILTNETHAFILYKDTARMGFFDLPVYDDSSARAKKIALTPLAVVADLTIIGGYAFIFFWAGIAGAR